MNLQPLFNLRIISCACSFALLSACSSQTAISPAVQSITAPEHWQQNVRQDSVEVGVISKQDNQAILGDWQLLITDEQLQSAIKQALSNSPELQISYRDFLIAKQQLNIAEADFYPELNLNINQSRNKSVAETTTSYNNNANIGLQLSYEIDLWGKLSASQRQASLQYKAREIAYQQAKNQLISDVVAAWYNVISAQKLLSLYQERAQNLQRNLDIINASYKLGLSEALDVYLTQNDVSREQARVTEQQQTVFERLRLLDVLLGQFPQAESFAGLSLALPQLPAELSVGLPSNLLAGSQHIQQKWYELLAADAALAVAYKQRFPQLNLTGATGDASDELGNLLSGGALTWSIAGGITAPIFNAGKLKSAQEQARLTVKKVEQEYLQTVYSEFADMENYISAHYSLAKQLVHYQAAKENALAAETLSFNQYLKGLVSYSTVLEAQRRAFDAQSNTISIENQLIQNRITIYAKLGGSHLAINFEQQEPASN
ncbi:efflux transporter outer membrane subunit [Colwellia sp. MEBiC06753]